MTSSRTLAYLFAGDSLTEGVYGESYVERVAKALYQGSGGLAGEVINAGRGGDTVQALLDRIDGPLRRHQPGWVILAVGINDVWLPWLGSHSLVWRMSNLVRRIGSGQSPTTDLDQLAAIYRALIDRAQTLSGARVLVCTVSPVGERLSSPVNRQLARLNGVIKHVAADRRVPVADVWQAFVEQIAAQPKPSTYAPGEWLFARIDRARLRRNTPDEIARRRRLLLTFDGIHLNGRGADLWADTVIAALAQAQGMDTAAVPPLARQLGLLYSGAGPLQLYCTPAWQARAQDLGRSLADAYERLAELTGVRPTVHLAVLNQVHWNQSSSPRAYPAPCAHWEGEMGTVFVPEAYNEQFMRDVRLPETVAGWSEWPRALADVGPSARATALADLLAIQELARLFLRELQVAPADPLLDDLLAAYLTQAVFSAAKGERASKMAAVWNAWGAALAQSGVQGGQIRQQARELYQKHGTDLASSLAQHMASLRDQVKVSPIPIAAESLS